MDVKRARAHVAGRAVARTLLLAVSIVGAAGNAAAATFTVVNNCGYTVYPGLYPAVYQNGGWVMAPGTSVSFGVSSGFIGRIWGRTGCNSASPAQCTTGQCGGTGLQCAGTTGQAGTSLAEFNINASGTDWCRKFQVEGYYLRIAPNKPGEGPARFENNVEVKNVYVIDFNNVIDFIFNDG
jgi:hypothetical protein